MRTFPKLKAPASSRKLTTIFGGYDHNAVIPENEFFNMQNMTSDLYPVASTARIHRQSTGAGGTPFQDAVALKNRDDHPVACDKEGNIWCGSHSISGLLKTEPRYLATIWDNGKQLNPSVDTAKFLSKKGNTAGIYNFRYAIDHGVWIDADDNIVYLDEYGITVSPEGEHRYAVLTVSVSHYEEAVPESLLPKQIVNMGAWCIIWPDKVYFNAVKLAAGDTLTEGVDYGSIENEVSIVSPQGADAPIFFIDPCTEDGTVVVPDAYHEADITNPSDGDYLCNMEQKQWYVYRVTDTGGFWEMTKIYTVLQAEGITSGFGAEDYISIESAFGIEKFEMPGSDDLSDGTLRRVVKTVGTNKLIIDAFWTGTYEQARDWEEDTPICTIRRSAPKLDYVVECGNRLWGCFYGEKDGEHINEIYACKLGDFKNWNTFAGISTDSYTASRGADGKYTGAAVLNGNPLFFRETSFEKVYPSAGGAHQIITENYAGIQEGSWQSPVVIDGVLYYKGRDGVYAYTGSIPRMISGQLGNTTYYDAVAAPMSRKYYISMRDANNVWELFVYDTERGMWHREDNVRFLFAAGHKGTLYYGAPDSSMEIAPDATRRNVDWMIESGIIGLTLPDQKRISRIVLRLRLELGATAKISVQYDSNGRWHDKMTLRGNGLRTLVAPIVPLRCDHMRIKMSGTGGMELYSMAYTEEQGSDVP